MRNLNPSISEDLNRTFNLKGESTDIVSDFIQPVKEIQPRVNILKSTTATYGSATIYTTPTDKDFYLIGLFHSFSKDATSDAPTGSFRLRCTIEGVTVDLAGLSVITLTTERNAVSIMFPLPIKLDRGTGISLVASTGSLGLLYRFASIYGYTQETTKGV